MSATQTSSDISCDNSDSQVVISIGTYLMQKIQKQPLENLSKTLQAPTDSASGNAAKVALCTVMRKLAPSATC